MCDIEDCYRNAEYEMTGLKYDEVTDLKVCSACRNAITNAFAWSNNTVEFEII